MPNQPTVTTLGGTKKQEINSKCIDLCKFYITAIYQLRAETFYKIGDYQNSIKEIYNSKENNSETFDVEFPFGDDDLIHLACNYVKLNDFQKAKSYLDKVGKGYYITTFIWANYYEVVGKKNIALDAYIGIKNQKESDHYFYYKDALQRIEELNRPNSKLLTELYYPSNRSDNEICITDNNIIGK